MTNSEYEHTLEAIAESIKRDEPLERAVAEDGEIFHKKYSPKLLKKVLPTMVRNVTGDEPTPKMTSVKSVQYKMEELAEEKKEVYK